MKRLLLMMSLLASFPLFSQGFIAAVAKDDLGVLFGRPAIVTLATGEEISGKMTGGSIVNGYLSTIVFKADDGTKSKFKPEDVQKLSIKASKLAKLAMMAESSSSIKEMTHSDFDEIVNREYIIFETAMRSNRAAKLRLMQLLNPGFDSKIKVFADPNAKETGGIGLGGIQLTGGQDKSYLFVINDQQAVLVKKGSYKRNFDDLYSSCPKMVEAFDGERLKWADVAGHVFAYDQACKE
jgi:hypothetical protein